MPLSMYQASVPVFTQALDALGNVLGKGEAHAAAKKIDLAVLLGARLAPDMFPLSRQLSIACDFAKGATARLAGIEVPAWPDEEKTFAEFKARVAKTSDYVRGFKPAQIDGSEEREISLKMRDATPHLQRPALPPALRAAELLLPRDHRLRHPAPQRRGAGQARLHGPGPGNVMAGNAPILKPGELLSLAGKTALVTGASSGLRPAFRARAERGPAPRWRWPRGAWSGCSGWRPRSAPSGGEAVGGGARRHRPGLGDARVRGGRGGARARSPSSSTTPACPPAPSSPRPARRNGATVMTRQPRRRVPRRPGGGAAHGGQRHRRLDHQHRLDPGLRRHQVAVGLLRRPRRRW